MSETLKDNIGALLWILMFVAPFLVTALAWKYLPFRKFHNILAGLCFSAILSFIFYHLSLAIIFRNGMGPG